MRTLLTLLAIGALFQQPPRTSAIQDGEAHGDPPYVLEDGWEPLLNGKDLAGWKACEAAAKNEWYTTRSVMFERLLGPTRLGGRAAPSGVILNGPTGRTANLCSERTFGDVELYLEFMLAKGSNSGVYLQGLYKSRSSTAGARSKASRHPTPAPSITAGSTSKVSADRRRSSTPRVVPENGSRTRRGFAPRASMRRARRRSRPASSACSSTVSSCRRKSTSTVRRGRAWRTRKPPWVR